MKPKWTRGEKWLWMAPLIFIVAAGVAAWGPGVMRRQLGRPMQLKLKANDKTICIALSPDGSTLAAMLAQPSLDQATGEIYFWNARTLESLPTMGTRPKPGKWHSWNSALALSPDGQWVSFAPNINQGTPSLKLYERATQRLHWKVDGLPNYYHSFENSTARFAPDGQSIVTARSSKNGSQALVLRANDGQVLTQWQSSVGIETALFAWSPDGKTLACVSEIKAPVTAANPRGIARQIEIRSTQNGKLLRRWNSSPLHSLDFSPDGRTLVAVTYQYSDPVSRTNYQVAVLDAMTGRELWRYGASAGADKQRSPYSFGDAKFSPDGKLVAALAHYDNGGLFFLNARTGALERTLSLGGQDSVRSNRPGDLAWAPDGKRLYARGQNAVLAWDLD